LALLSPGFKYKKSGGTKTYKILKLQNKKTDINYILNPVRGAPFFLIQIRFLGKPAFATEIQKKCFKPIFLKYNYLNGLRGCSGCACDRNQNQVVEPKSSLITT